LDSGAGNLHPGRTVRARARGGDNHNRKALDSDRSAFNGGPVPF
jgi:hypothetical protein